MEKDHLESDIAASRRQFMVTAGSGIAALSLAGLSPSAFAVAAATYKERYVQRGKYKLYAREWAGTGPTYILLHGFPDNLHIFDSLAPLLAAEGKHVVSFDFLGFGSSDKPTDVALNFEQQLGDLVAVADALGHKTVIPVGHDAGGPTAINFGIQHPSRTASLVIFNTFYTDAPGLVFPELIQLFADPALHELAMGMVSDPGRFKYLLDFQKERFLVNASPARKELFGRVIRPIFDDNFKNGAGPAFVQMTADLRTEILFNTSQAGKLKSFTPKVNVIWGTGDSYLTPSVAADIAGRFPNGKVFPVDAGHWLQIDEPEQVARLMIANA